ncbi:MAG: hypothetical protein WD054_00685 [Gemmatimonadota bacterium]
MNRLGILACSAAVTLGIAALARAPWSPPGAAQATLRLSWRMTVSARENCRPRTEQELAGVPVHMRTPEVCTPDEATYALITQIDDAPPDTVELIRGGVKGDRPLFVLEQRALPEGEHRVRIALERLASSGAATLTQLDTVLTLVHGGVQLITMDDDGQLIHRARAGPPQSPR